MALAVGFVGASLPAIAASQPTCASGDPVVWENTSTKVYHEQGDKYYGNTKAGTYVCKSDADKAGFHLSKSKSKGGSSSSSSTSDDSSTAGSAATSAASSAPGTMASGAPTGKHHRHKKGSAMASPAPGTMGSAAPDAMTSPAPGASPMGKHHRHKKGSAMASPAPAPSAT